MRKVSQKRNTVYFVFYARNAVKCPAVHANPYGGGSGNRVYNNIYYIWPRCVCEAVVVNVRCGLFSISVRESWTRKYNNNSAQIGHRCNLGGHRARTTKAYLLLLLLLLMIPSTLACHPPPTHPRNTTLPTTRVETLSIYNALLQLYIRISAETTVCVYIYRCRWFIAWWAPIPKCILHRDLGFYVIFTFLTKHENIIFSYGVLETMGIANVPIVPVISYDFMSILKDYDMYLFESRCNCCRWLSQ